MNPSRIAPGVHTWFQQQVAAGHIQQVDEQPNRFHLPITDKVQSPLALVGTTRTGSSLFVQRAANPADQPALEARVHQLVGDYYRAIGGHPGPGVDWEVQVHYVDRLRPSL